jgi:hypothetical protein
MAFWYQLPLTNETRVLSSLFAMMCKENKKNEKLAYHECRSRKDGSSTHPTALTDQNQDRNAKNGGEKPVMEQSNEKFYPKTRPPPSRGILAYLV